MIFLNPLVEWKDFPTATANFAISQNFGENPEFYKSITYYANDPLWPNRPIGGHDGRDLACPTNSLVLPMVAGRCEWVGQDSKGGRGIKLRSPDPENPYIEWEHIYWHNLTNLARAGEWYDTTTPIAYSDDTGWSTGPHLHLGVRRWSLNVQQNNHPYTWLRNIIDYYNGYLGYVNFDIKPRKNMVVAFKKQGDATVYFEAGGKLIAVGLTWPEFQQSFGSVVVVDIDPATFNKFDIAANCKLVKN